MKSAITILGLIIAFFLTANVVLGYRETYQIGYGAITILGLGISGTFLWLWWVRATPLALGMAFSWAGASCVMGWWWAYDILDRPRIMQENPGLFVFLSLYIVGATLHFRVIEDALAWPRKAFLLPLCGATFLSLLIWLLG